MNARRTTIARYHRLIAGADPAALRLLACDLAADVLAICGDEYQGDHRPQITIEVARRYAAGGATEPERRGASMLISALCTELADDRSLRRAHAAANATAFTLWKDARFGFRQAIEWLADARGYGWQDLTRYSQYFARLEALQRA